MAPELSESEKEALRKFEEARAIKRQHHRDTHERMMREVDPTFSLPPEKD